MKILIDNKNDYQRDFVYNYLPKRIASLTLSSLDEKRLKEIDKFYNINSKEIFKLAVNNLKVSETETTYVIEINKNLKWKKLGLNSLINLITYGSRSFKGYNILYKIFSAVKSNLDVLYERWLINI